MADMEIDNGTSQAESVPAELVQRLKAKYGEDLISFPTVMGVCVWRRPSKAEYRQFTNAVLKATQAGGRTSAGVEEHMANLVTQCFVFPDDGNGVPDRAVFQSLYDRRPAFIPIVCSALTDLAGASDDATPTKL